MVPGLLNRHARRDSVGFFGDSGMPKVRDSPASLRRGRVVAHDDRANCDGQRRSNGGRGTCNVWRRLLACTIIRWGSGDLWGGRSFFVARLRRLRKSSLIPGGHAAVAAFCGLIRNGRDYRRLSKTSVHLFRGHYILSCHLPAGAAFRYPDYCDYSRSCAGCDWPLTAFRPCVTLTKAGKSRCAARSFWRRRPSQPRLKQVK